MRLSAVLTLLLAILVACGDTPDANDQGRSLRTEATSLKGLAAIEAFITRWEKDVGPIKGDNMNWRLDVPEPPNVAYDPAKRYVWQLETSKGEIQLELWPEIAPFHVTNTIYLTELGFYDDLVFHRIIPTFMAQGGCPLGNGGGGPGYKFAGEIDRKVRHDSRGLLSAANTGKPKTDGSQFFITFNSANHLDGKHTIYGKVIEGESTLVKIEKQGSPTGSPKRPVKLIKATIIESDR